MITVLLVDNYDSFTYNLAQALGALGASVDVVRADDELLAAALDAAPDRVVISPGPGRPEAAGRSPSLVREAPERGIRTLGVCLGLQCAAIAFGARVVRAPAARRQRDLRRCLRSDGGDAIPLAHGRRSLASRRSGRDRPQRRRRRHGPAPCTASARGRAVPPGIGAHERRD